MRAFLVSTVDIKASQNTAFVFYTVLMFDKKLESEPICCLKKILQDIPSEKTLSSTKISKYSDSQVRFLKLYFATLLLYFYIIALHLSSGSKQYVLMTYYSVRLETL